jgi:predicted nucleic acid-binding protein
VIVIDASLLLERLLGEPASLTAVANATAAAPGAPLQAPELIELELLQALRRMVRIGAVSEDRAVDALTDLEETRLERHGHRDLRAGVWELRNRLTAYDAAYVVLAHHLGADVLLTRDSGMAGVARDVLGAARVTHV